MTNDLTALRLIEEAIADLSGWEFGEERSVHRQRYRSPDPADALCLPAGVCGGGLFSLGINLLMLTVPLYMLQLFDRVLLSRSMETLLLLSLLAGVALLTPALLEAAPLARGPPCTCRCRGARSRSRPCTTHTRARPGWS